MTTEEALKVLKWYNEWSRGAEMEMPDPKQAGEAVDVAIETLKKINNNSNNDIMTTKFMTLGDSKKTGKKTVFKTLLNSSFTAIKADSQPKDYTNVLFLGHDDGYGDVFKAWRDDQDNFILYFGEKGDEFND